MNTHGYIPHGARCHLAQHKLTLAISLALSTLTPLAHAADNTLQLQTEALAVTANPLGATGDNLVTPVSVLNGRELSLKRDSATLGELLNGTPGVSSSYYGPGASRPIIRGMDGDRVRILQNGVGLLDASALSPDHAVAVDPAIIEQVDVVRGPATLLYGGGAIGGVVNAIDHRIPKQALDGVTGRYEARYGGADNQKSGVGIADIGNGKFTLHVDAYARETDDLSIPDYAKIPQLRSTTDRKGTLVNSHARGSGGALGGAWTFDKGYAGLSFSTMQNNYGSVVEQDVRIDQRSNRLDFAGELHGLSGVINRLKFKAAYTDYQHKEIEDGTVGTTFKNKGWDGTLEAAHKPFAKLNGVVGYQFQRTQFQALGEEAFVPKTNTRLDALYIYEELPLAINRADDLKLTAGARVEKVSQQSDGGGKFGDASTRDFTPTSGALGAVYHLDTQWSLATNLSHNERAPTYNELFAYGAHLATGQYEIGNNALNKEKSNGIDAEIRWKQGAHSASLGAFYTRFNQFIYLQPTGNMVDAEGEAGGNLSEANFTGVNARFKGIEGQAKFRIYDDLGKLDLRLRGDYVNAVNTHTGGYLPRIAPLRLGIGLDYQLNRFGARLDVLRAFAQNKVAQNELPTDGYTAVNLMATYKLPVKYQLEVFAKANNLLNQTIRDSSSYLKDIAPQGARSLLVGLRGDF